MPETSLEVVNAVVLALKLALDVYKANLKVSPEEASKSCAPTKSSFLKLLHTACVIAFKVS